MFTVNMPQSGRDHVTSQKFPRHLHLHPLLITGQQINIPNPMHHHFNFIHPFPPASKVANAFLGKDGPNALMEATDLAKIVVHGSYILTVPGKSKKS